MAKRRYNCSKFTSKLAKDYGMHQKRPALAPKSTKKGYSQSGYWEISLMLDRMIGQWTGSSLHRSRVRHPIGTKGTDPIRFGIHDGVQGPKAPRDSRALARQHRKDTRTSNSAVILRRPVPVRTTVRCIAAFRKAKRGVLSIH